MLSYDDIITIKRKDPATGIPSDIYVDIEADVQINNKGNDGGDNSDNAEIADYFVFIKKENNDLKNGDNIYYTNYFNESIILKVISKDLIDFTSIDPFIEILCSKK